MPLYARHSGQVRRIANVHSVTHQALVIAHSTERDNTSLSAVNGNSHVNLQQTCIVILLTFILIILRTVLFAFRRTVTVQSS